MFDPHLSSGGLSTCQTKSNIQKKGSQRVQCCIFVVIIKSNKSESLCCIKAESDVLLSFLQDLSLDAGHVVQPSVPHSVHYFVLLCNCSLLLFFCLAQLLIVSLRLSVSLYLQIICSLNLSAMSLCPFPLLWPDTVTAGHFTFSTSRYNNEINYLTLSEISFFLSSFFGHWEAKI